MNTHMCFEDVYTCVCMYACVYIDTHTYIGIQLCISYNYLSLYIYIHICIHIHRYIYIYIYIHTYIHTYTGRPGAAL